VRKKSPDVVEEFAQHLTRDDDLRTTDAIIGQNRDDLAHVPGTL